MGVTNTYTYYLSHDTKEAFIVGTITAGKIYNVFVDKWLDEYIIKGNKVRLYFGVNLDYYNDDFESSN